MVISKEFLKKMNMYKDIISPEPVKQRGLY